jgi:hypothetical protein
MWSSRASLVLSCLLIAGCSPAPFPGGDVEIDGQQYALSAPAVDLRAPRDEVQAARWWRDWHEARHGDPLRPWALARFELLRDHAVPASALALLDEVVVPEQHRCHLDADRVVALWLDDRPGRAISEQGCASRTADGRALLARLLADHHLYAAAAELDPSLAGLDLEGRNERGELIDDVDSRTLARDGLPAASHAIHAPTPAARQAALDELARLTDRHCDRYARPDEARGWWHDLVDEPPTSPVARALDDLLATPGATPATLQDARPETVAEAVQRAERLEALATTLGEVGGGLPASRALYLRAWGLELTGAPGFTSAWEEAAEVGAAWPAIRVAAGSRLVGHLLRHAEHEQARAQLDALLSLARRHDLAGLDVNLTRRKAQLVARPALLHDQLEDMLALYRRRAPQMDGEAILSLQITLTAIGVAVGAKPFVDAVCLENERLAVAWSSSRSASGCPTALARFEDDPVRGAELAELAIERATEAGSSAGVLNAAAWAALRAFRRGDRDAAEEWLARGEEVRQEAGRWGFELDLARLNDPGAPPAALAAADATMARIGFEQQDQEFWLLRGYGDWIESHELDADAAVALLARLEAIRWFDGADPGVRSADPDVVAYFMSSLRAPRIAASWRPSPEDAPPGSPPAAFWFDTAAVEGDLQVLQGRTPPPRGALVGLGAWLGDLEATGRSGPLLGLGTGPGSAVPTALIPIDGRPLGAGRPTGLWVPVRTEVPSSWTTGILVSAVGRPGAPGLLGVDALVAGRPAGWSTATVSTRAGLVAELAGVDVVHLSAHGHSDVQAQTVLALGPEPEDELDAATLRSAELAPGALVVLAACGAGGDTPGGTPIDLPMAAFQAGAGAVLFSRFPAPARPLHEALARLYDQLPFPCTELVERWHRIRVGYGLELLGIEVAVSTPCLPSQEIGGPAPR